MRASAFALFTLIGALTMVGCAQRTAKTEQLGESFDAYQNLMPYFVKDTNTITPPHITYTLLVDTSMTRVGYAGQWTSDKSGLCERLINEAAAQQRSALFTLASTSGDISLDRIMDLAQNVVHAYERADLDHEAVKCFMYSTVEKPPVQARQLAEQGPEVKRIVHINADGSLQLHERPIALNALGDTLEQQQVTFVVIDADRSATIQSLVEVMQVCAKHQVKAILGTGGPNAGGSVETH